MPITRTAKGMSASKSGLEEEITGVEVAAGCLLEVTLAYETPGGNPTSVTYGGLAMIIVQDTTATRGDTRIRKYRLKVKTKRTKVVRATWATDPAARCMFAVEIGEASMRDVSGSNNQGAGTNLDTTNVGTTTTADTYQSAAFACSGPDQAVTPDAGWTLGQKIATSGGAVGSNVMLFELYRIAAATEAVQAGATLTTGRICASCVVAYKARETWTLDSIEQPGYRAGPLGNAAVFRWSAASGGGKDVVVPADLFEAYTDRELIDFCIQALELKSEVDANEDPAVQTLSAARVTALEGTAVVI